MKKIIYACSVLVVASLSSCQKENLAGVANDIVTLGHSVELTASIDEGATRTYVDENGQVIWEMSDSLSVFYENTAVSTFTIKSIDTNGTDATLYCSRPNQSGEPISHRIGVYPYDAQATVAYDGATGNYSIRTSFPAVQSYKEGSFGHKASPMVGITTEVNFSFKNVGSSIKVMIKGTTGEETVTKIEAFTTGRRKLAGSCTYTVSEGSVVPTVVLDEELATDKIVLDCGTGVMLSSTEATEFIFTLPPMEFEDNELVFRVYNEEGKYVDITKQSAFECLRSTIVKVGGDDGYTYETPAYAAVVNGEAYEDAAAAVEAAQEILSGGNETDSEVELDVFSDIELTGTTTGAAHQRRNAVTRTGEVTEDVVMAALDQIVVPNGKTLTLNLNGHTISQVKECTSNHSMILNNGTLVIIGNGKISFTDTGAGDPNAGWGVYTVRNQGTLIVENGTIENLSAQNKVGGAFKHTAITLFQYSGSSIINGGKISAPNYRSVRLWKGDVTINGGEFEGQVWIQAVDNTANMTINGGSFRPSWNDGSSVFIENKTYDVVFAATDGFFNTKIGCSLPGKEDVIVTGGVFTQAAKDNTNAALLAEGYEFVDNGDGTYTVQKMAE